MRSKANSWLGSEGETSAMESSWLGSKGEDECDGEEDEAGRVLWQRRGGQSGLCSGSLAKTGRVK